MINKKLFNKYFPGDRFFTPHTDIPVDDWENRNRKPWSQRDIDDLWKKEVGEFEFTLNGCDILIKPVDRNEAAKLYHYEKKEPGKLFCGKVIKLGNLAQGLTCFPRGASCTYNDYVMFSIQKCEPLDLGPYRYFLVNDLDILGVIDDPYALIKDYK